MKKKKIGLIYVLFTLSAPNAFCKPAEVKLATYYHQKTATQTVHYLAAEQAAKALNYDPSVQENPPLSVKSAVKAGLQSMKVRMPHESEWNLESIALQRTSRPKGQEELWYYLVSFFGAKNHWQYAYVLMDGSVAKVRTEFVGKKPKPK